MKKKILSTVFVGAMVMCLAACVGGQSSGGGDPSSGNIGESFGGDKGGTISVAIWDSGQRAGLNENYLYDGWPCRISG